MAPSSSVPLPTLEQLPLLILLILPGFISRKVYDLRVPSQADDGTKYVFDALFYGVLNLGLWIVPLLWVLDRYPESPVILVAVSVAALIVSPLLLALATVSILSSSRLRRWIVHPTPTAWDYFFGLRKPCWILCRLRGGKSIAGYFGGRAFASSFPHRRDVYIEKVWLVDESGRFTQPIRESAGALISMDDCELVEFFEVLEDTSRSTQHGEQDSGATTPPPERGISAS